MRLKSLYEEYRRGAHLPPWARKWMNRWNLWRMVTATPDLRLPSQSHGINAHWPVNHWPVPNYTQLNFTTKCDRKKQNRKRTQLNLTKQNNNNYSSSLSVQSVLCIFTTHYIQLYFIIVYAWNLASNFFTRLDQRTLGRSNYNLQPPGHPVV